MERLKTTVKKINTFKEGFFKLNLKKLKLKKVTWRSLPIMIGKVIDMIRFETRVKKKSTFYFRVFSSIKALLSSKS
jgi:hypothetical protein